MRKTSIDAAERIRELEEEEIPKLDEAQKEIMDAIAENEDIESADDAPTSLRNKWEKLESQKVELRGQRNAIRMDLIDWSDKYDLTEFTKGDRDWNDVKWSSIDSVFGLHKMNAATYADLADQISAQSFEFDIENESVEGSPKGAMAKVLTVKRTLVAWPEGAPVDDKGLAQVGEYDFKHVEWLFDKANNLNTVGDVDLGNSSFREAVNSAND